MYQFPLRGKPLWETKHTFYEFLWLFIKEKTWSLWNLWLRDLVIWHGHGICESWVGFLLSEACIAQSTQMELGYSLEANSLLKTSWESVCSSPCPRAWPQAGLSKPTGWGSIPLSHAREQGVHAAAAPAVSHSQPIPTALFPDGKGAELPAASCGTQHSHSGTHFQTGIISSLYLLSCE